MPTNITDANTFADPLTTRADGDAVNAANVLAHCNQGLADRTRYLMKAIAGSNDVIASEQVQHAIKLDAGFFEEAPGLPLTLIEVQVPIAEATVLAVNNDGVLTQWGTRVSGSGFQYKMNLEADSQVVQFELSDKIPYGAELTRVRALVEPNIAEATSTDRMRMTVQSWSDDFSTPASGSITEAADIRDDGTANLQVMDSGAISIRNDGLTSIVCQIRASINAADAAADEVYSLQLQYSYNRRPILSQRSFFSGASGGTALYLVHQSASQTGKVICELARLVPNGATVDTVRVLVKPGAARAASSRVNASLWSNQLRDYSTGSPTPGNPVQEGSTVEDDGTVAIQSLEISPAYDHDGSELTLLVEGGDGDWDEDIIYGVEVTFTDPGARNF